ncbi:unnamed protein product [Mytilus edulis]|uniref:PHR domain-containing protein n=1 Tax=Mytilus edulis TaxID=6550 RepID=A0A8S3Q9N7_MYTED|nr:unnamed protein product [Mytilus edulis]
MRKIIGSLLYLVNFPFLNREYFAKEIAHSGLLTSEEVVSVFSSHYGRKNEFFTGSVGHSRVFHQHYTVLRHGSTVGSWDPYEDIINYDALNIKVNKNIELKSVILYGPNGDVSSSAKTLTVKILNDSGNEIYSQKYESCTESQELQTVNLNEPIKLDSNKYFTIILVGLKFKAHSGTKCKPEYRIDDVIYSVPMRLRALPQSFWKQPNCPSNVSPGNLFPSLPPLGTKETGEDFQDVRPITPPEDKMKKPSRPAQERKLIITGDTDLWMKKLFDRVKPEGHKDQGSIRRGNRQKKVTIPTKVHITNSKAIVSGEDPYLVDTIADKYLPHLSLDNKNGYGGTASLQLVTLREGDKSVTLPSLSVEQNYSQMLTELVMNI